MLNFFELLTFSETLNELNDKFNAWTDKFTSNGTVASIVTLLFFVVVCVGLSKFSNK